VITLALLLAVTESLAADTSTIGRIVMRTINLQLACYLL
jgi:hypothetical protein